MRNIIITDTDFETDCDDTGALAIMHGLADRGVWEIGGVCASICSPWPAAGVKALNCAFGRPEIPVATNRQRSGVDPDCRRGGAGQQNFSYKGTLFFSILSTGIKLETTIPAPRPLGAGAPASPFIAG